MFNTLARKQFITHLDKVGLPETRQPAVHTFHSLQLPHHQPDGEERRSACHHPVLAGR